VSTDDAVGSWWRTLGAQWSELRRVVGFWEPVASLPGWTAPALIVGALLALVALSGIALAALGVLLTALLIAHLLLDRVFGVSVALVPPR
jgi:hypothetical protein